MNGEVKPADAVALDDISATEWRRLWGCLARRGRVLHSMISVLPNGGSPAPHKVGRTGCCTR